jgi:hypothetical protein
MLHLSQDSAVALSLREIMTRRGPVRRLAMFRACRRPQPIPSPKAEHPIGCAIDGGPFAVYPAQ